MSELGAFQAAFERALAGDAADLFPWLVRAEDPGVDLYRNTTLAGAVDALAAAYPTVLKMTGETWFRAAAAAFARETPPLSASLIGYGGDFPAWIEQFAPAADTPYLGSIAQIDRLWWEAYFSREAPCLAGDALANLTEADLDALSLELHPAVRLGVFGQNTVSLWLAQQLPSPPAFAIEHQAEFVLISRPEVHVDASAIGVGEHAFFSACDHRHSLREAADAALSCACGPDLPSIIALGLEKGAFARLRPAQGSFQP